MPTPPRILTHNGQSLPIDEWSRRTGLAVETIRCRIDRLGWTHAHAINTPADLVEAGYARKTITGYAYSRSRALRWGVGQSLIPADVHGSLIAVETLKAGRTAAPERQPRRVGPAAT